MSWAKLLEQWHVLPTSTPKLIYIHIVYIVSYNQLHVQVCYIDFISIYAHLFTMSHTHFCNCYIPSSRRHANYVHLQSWNVLSHDVRLTISHQYLQSKKETHANDRFHFIWARANKKNRSCKYQPTSSYSPNLGTARKKNHNFSGENVQVNLISKQTSSASLSFLSQLTVFVKSIGPNLSSRWKSPYFFWWSYSFHQHIIHINPSLPKKCGILGLRQHNAKVVLSDRWHACRWMAESNWDNDFQHVSKTHSLDISWILFGQKACKSSAFTSIRCFRLLFVLIQVWLESTQTASRICSALFRSKAPWPWRAWSKC